MNKKTLSIILIAAGVLLIVYLIFKKKSDSTGDTITEASNSTEKKNNRTSGSNPSAEINTDSGKRGASNSISSKIYNKKDLAKICNTAGYYVRKKTGGIDNYDDAYIRALSNSGASNTAAIRADFPTWSEFKSFCYNNWNDIRGNFNSDGRKAIGVN